MLSSPGGGFKESFVGDRQFNNMDMRYLSSLRAPVDDERFQKAYFSKRDRWERMHPEGALPAANLLDLVCDYEDMIAKEKADVIAAKPTKKLEKVA
jgi:hypothetical protein